MRETVRELGEQRAFGFLKKFYGWYLGRGRFPRPFKQELVMLPIARRGRDAPARGGARRAVRARAARVRAAGPGRRGAARLAADLDLRRRLAAGPPFRAGRAAPSISVTSSKGAQMRSSRGIRTVSVLVGVALCSVPALHSRRARPRRASRGRWSGKYSGTYSGSFTLTWKLAKSKLSGTITLSKPKGQVRHHRQAWASAARSASESVAVGATYTGSVTGLKMSGKYNTPAAGAAAGSAHEGADAGQA